MHTKKKSFPAMYFTLLTLLSMLTIKCVSQVHICTVCKYPSKKVCERLHKSVEALGVPLEYLGEDATFTKNSDKLPILLNFLKTIPDDDIIIFLDGRDIFVVGSLEEAITKFKNTGAKWFISTERWCWPDKNLAPLFPDNPSPLKYINSGAFIGYAGFVRDLLTKMKPLMKDDIRSDQLIFAQFLVRDNRHLLDDGLVKLDYNCEIFLTLKSVNVNDVFLDESNLRIIYIPSNSMPFAIHGNGNEELWKELSKKIYGI